MFQRKILLKGDDHIKRVISVFLTIILIASLQMNIFAKTSCFNWYCVHRKDHKQPTADSMISFVEKYNGYYVDKKHGDDCVDKVVYLTFDAGYENGNVAKILQALKEEEVTAAFFVLGHIIDNNTDLIGQMFEDGHLVCNHTFSHCSMVGKSKEEIKIELERLEELCLRKTGRHMTKFYRPPEGKFDEESMRYINDLGYTTVFWSFAYADWDNNNQMSCEKAKCKIIENLHNGEIMLLHPTSKTNADIIKDVIREIKSRGYRFGSLNEIAE